MKTYIQITGGRGPVECSRAVVLILKKFIADAINKGIELTLVDHEDHNTEDNCMLSVILSTEENVESLKSEWEGTILWVATSNPFRPKHKRKNWFVGINFFSEADTIDIKEEDISYETCRSSGPGGQNVNKVETAVRATHKPTGLSVLAEDERSQVRNKSLAKERLILKLSAINEEKKAEHERKIWMSHNFVLRGNQVKKFVGPL